MPNLHSRLPFHYGWIIVCLGILILFACLGLARFAYGMLLPAMREGLGLAYDQMGYISTANFAGYLIAVALAPLAIRRFKPRLTITCGLLLIACCMLAISQSSSFLVVLLLYTLTGIGSGFANIPVMVLVSHWFRRERRGRAAGLMVIGNGVAIVFSGFFIPFLNQQFGEQGWRIGWLSLGLIAICISVIAALLLRNEPKEMGMEPVGRKVALDVETMSVQEPSNGGQIILWLGLLYLIFGATYMVYGTFIVTTMVVEFNFAESTAGMFWSWVGFFGLFSGVLFGTLSDKIGRKAGLIVVFTVQTLAYLLAGSGVGTTALMASVALYGIAAFAIPTIMAAAVADYMGLNKAAAAFSIVTLFFAVGQTVGPGVAGLIAEASGSFTTSYLCAAALTGTAILFAIFLPNPRSKD
ncbi:MAG TPA: MFS transporter [Geopsychrobacteraceae bacterium]|nr:MFS transporter [Geopsychrobacteraceae bacterium]